MVYNLAWCDFREKKDKQISAECLSNLASNSCSKVVLATGSCNWYEHRYDFNDINTIINPI